MVSVHDLPDFSLEKFIENISSCRSDDVVSDDVYKAICEIYDIIFGRLDGKYQGIENDSLFDYFTCDDIEWFSDQLLFFPCIEADEESSLKHYLVQYLMSDDIMGSISQVKPTKKKGFVFI